MRTQGAMLVAAALFLVAAAPASAVTGGFGVASAVHSGGAPGRGRNEDDEPQAGLVRGRQLASTRRRRRSGAYGKLGQLNQPVACEQPPRSEFISPHALKQATAAAISVLG